MNEIMINPVKLDSSWVSLSLAGCDKLSIVKSSPNIYFRSQTTSSIQLRAGISTYNLGFVELNCNGTSIQLLCILNDTSHASYKHLSMHQGPNSLKLDRVVDKKLYVSSDFIPNEIYIFWMNRLIPFNRRGKNINFLLPTEAYKTTKSYVRIYANRNQGATFENAASSVSSLMIPLEYGKTISDSESVTPRQLNAIVSSDLSDQRQESKTKIINENLPNTESKENAQIKDSVVSKQNSNPKIFNWFSAYIDTYFALYSDSVGANNFEKFTNISPKNNSFGLNTAQFNFDYAGDKIRGKLVLHFGDYATNSWSRDYNNVMEANIGFKLLKRLWIDVGFFRSYIGTEGLLPRENICSYNSLIAFSEHSSFSGFRINYELNDRCIINFYGLNSFNGFQENNRKKSFGTLITYTLNKEFSFGYSNYLGDDTPATKDSVAHFSFYNNLFCNYQANKITVQTGIDFARQSNSSLKNARSAAFYFGALITFKYKLTDRISLYSRAELFDDPHGFLAGLELNASGMLKGYSVWSFTGGVEYRLTKNSFIRLENRDLQMNNDLQPFHEHNKNVGHRSDFACNFGLSF